MATGRDTAAEATAQLLINLGLTADATDAEIATVARRVGVLADLELSPDATDGEYRKAGSNSGEFGAGTLTLTRGRSFIA